MLNNGKEAKQNQNSRVICVENEHMKHLNELGAAEI